MPSLNRPSYVGYGVAVCVVLLVVVYVAQRYGTCFAVFAGIFSLTLVSYQWSREARTIRINEQMREAEQARKEEQDRRRIEEYRQQQAAVERMRQALPGTWFHVATNLRTARSELRREALERFIETSKNGEDTLPPLPAAGANEIVGLFPGSYERARAACLLAPHVARAMKQGPSARKPELVCPRCGRVGRRSGVYCSACGTCMVFADFKDRR